MGVCITWGGKIDAMELAGGGGRGSSNASMPTEPVTCTSSSCDPKFEWALSHTRPSLSNNTFAALLTAIIASEIKFAHLLTLILGQTGPCKRIAMTLGV
jgi:hypothetical protein